MNNYSVVKIQTPKKFLLDGLFLDRKNKGVFYIYVHGLGSNLFSNLELVESVAGVENSLLVFNNRGNGTISRIKQLDKKSKKGHISHKIGMAHEVFTDCIDDLEGAVNFALNTGAKQIVLVGHSTGCQKSVYYLVKKPKTAVEKVVLLAPMSDFADVFTFVDKKVYKKAVLLAKKLVNQKKEHELLPMSVWPHTVDAQRFLSLHTADSVEEIFSYANDKKPTILKKVTKPILVVLAGDDEYRDRPMEDIFGWFSDVLVKNNAKIKTINNAPHNFHNYSSEVSLTVKSWVKGKKT